MCDLSESQTINQMQYFNPCDGIADSQADLTCSPSAQCAQYQASCQPNEDYSQNQCFEKCLPENYQFLPQMCLPRCPPAEELYCPTPTTPCYQSRRDRPVTRRSNCSFSCQSCDPCQPLRPCRSLCQSPPSEACSPICSPYKLRCYVQPPRRESCKPIIRYQRPSIPMASDTVYKNSFAADALGSCRTRLIYPTGQLTSPCGDFAKDTITKLSFRRHHCPERTRPIYPISPSLFGQGPMQNLTTQKHDFVPKFQYRRSKCVPRDNIRRRCGYIEAETIQRRSYMPPDMCKFTRVQSCKPIINYKPPELPMEFETTQKLSFRPVCPVPRQAHRVQHQYRRPTVKFARDTVAKLSYRPPGCFLEKKDFSCPVRCIEQPSC